MQLEVASPLQPIRLIDIRVGLQMVLKIERASDGQLVILRLSGRLQSEHVDQLTRQMEGSRKRIALDLAEVKLVDRDAVRFLESCEANGTELSQCPLYIREWINRERALPGMTSSKNRSGATGTRAKKQE
jgi:hypothetical protein